MTAALFSLAEAGTVSLIFFLLVRGVGLSVPPSCFVQLWAAAFPPCFAVLLLDRRRKRAGIPREPDGKLLFHDENGVLRLAVLAERVICIEAEGNYAVVRYAADGGTGAARHPVRCRMHVLEARFEGTPLVRCSRSRIVNMDRVRLLRKEEDGYVLELETGTVGVTRTYERRVLAALGGR